jgi:guanosine-3',5'-bis(diphosphate) 3'-pyrophosphohydrolase
VITLALTTKDRVHLADIMKKIRVMPHALRVKRRKH